MPEFFFKTAAGQPAFSEEVCTQAFEPSRPYPQNPQAIIYRARFKQLRAYYTKPAPNAPHPNLPQVYFADDVDFQDKTSGLIEWTRVYSTAPTSWNDFASTAYTFPGLSGIRVPVSKTVTEKIVQDYFLVGTLANYDNRLLNYDAPGGTNWFTAQVNVTPNSVNIPVCAGGTTTANEIVDDGSTAIHYTMQTGGQNGTPPLSIFLKSNTTNVARLSLVAFGAPDFDSAYATFDLRTGLVTANANATGVVAAIGEGWWRVGIQNVVGSKTNAALAVVLCNDNGNTTYAGSGKGLWAWRAQLPNSTTIPHATVPPVLTPDSTNYPVPNADNILVKFGLQYIYQWSQNVAAEYLDGSTAPNINTWNGWVALDAANGNSNSYSVESADSTLSLWQGSIWQRQRHFVKAR